MNIKFVPFRLAIVLIFFSFCTYVSAEKVRQEDRLNKENIKILVLIIASDDLPVYKELQKIWRSYMHYNPNQVEAYFIKANPSLSSMYQIQEDIIWSKSQESLIPGIINKTILSLELMLPRIQQEFDYVLRTNLSSFYVFPRLLKFLETCPRKKFYGGVNIGVPGIGCGCGFLMSPDIVEMLVGNQKYFLNNRTSYDDVVIGQFLKNRNITLVSHPRMDFYTCNMWEKNKNNISDDVFQFRIKNAPHLRLVDDIYIHRQLLEIFYK